MAIKVGNKGVANIFIGSTPVKSVYKGNTKIWPSESWHVISTSLSRYYSKTTPTDYSSTYENQNLIYKDGNSLPNFPVNTKKIRLTISSYNHKSRETYNYPETISYNLTVSCGESKEIEIDLSDLTTEVSKDCSVSCSNSTSVLKCNISKTADKISIKNFTGKCLRGGNSAGDCTTPCMNITKVEAYY